MTTSISIHLLLRGSLGLLEIFGKMFEKSFLIYNFSILVF